MKDSLDYFSALLGLRMMTTCKHLRNKAYPPNSSILQTAQQTLVFHCVLKDELDILVGRFDQMKSTLESYLQGNDLSEVLESDEDIYAYCRSQFEGECPLGQVTDELNAWVSTHTEREQRNREGFDLFFPNLNFMILDDATNDVREVTDSELFNSKTKGLLKDIEMSNSLQEFNDRMRQVLQMIVNRQDVAQILQAMTNN